MDKFQQRLNDALPIVLDGGLATELERAGHDIGHALWSAALLADNPGAIVRAHRAYLDAGAECIISASYQASRAGFMSRGFNATQADALIQKAVELAAQSRDQFVADNPAVAYVPLVGASVGPYGATLHDGSEYTGKYAADRREIYDFHAERLPNLVTGDADFLAIETIPNAVEAAVLAELTADIDKPAWLSFACRDEAHISDGTPLEELAVALADHPRILALGINCTSPKFVTALVRKLKRAAPGKAIVVYPNSGETYHVEDNSWSGAACDLDADFNVTDWLDAGAKLIGGCCRTGPQHIAAMKARIAGHQH